MSFLSLNLLCLWFLSCVVLPCLGQATSLFQWGFTDSSLTAELPACAPLPIVVMSRNAADDDDEGVAPYYMTAYVLGGTPVTTLIGTDEDALSWTVNVPVGSRVVLSVVDATRSTGGVAPLTYTIIAGNTTSCIATPPQNPQFRFSANVTGDLTTCQPWGLSITGGVPPYTVSIAQPNSFTVTNLSMPAGTDRFTYINRGAPDTQLLAAVSDSTGRWAAGTPIVNTKGSTNVTCPGLLSTSINSTAVMASDTAATEAEAASRRRRSILIIAITAVSAFLLLIGALGVAVCFAMRKRRRRMVQEEEASTVPRQFIAEPSPYPPTQYSGSIGYSFNTSISSLPTQTSTSSKTRLMQPRSLYIPPLPESPAVASSSTASASQMSAAAGSDITSPGERTRPTLYSRPSVSTTATSSVRPSAKAAEAGVYHSRSPELEYPESALPDSSNVLGRITSTSTAADSMRGRPSQMPTVREYPESSVLYANPETGEVGACPKTGAGLQLADEPPPPYADRRSRGLM
ncbi:unnamed protein product [Cyclocybe aegerita]|uniref:Transmembrane protein n=1 Tax=Cyclocybe aegerita TaxID=1973307 RepID=A0A8S0XIP9_CYCAE|nr:unnamed protein product [Cyclocybe aegerita]